MSKTDFRDKKLPGEQGTIVTAEIMARLNNQVPTGEDFDGSAPLLHGGDTGAANAYETYIVLGMRVATGLNTSFETGKLVDAGASFTSSGVREGDTALNVYDLSSANVTAVSETWLSLDADIFTTTGAQYAVGPHIFQAPQSLGAGTEIAFWASNANTGASTFNVNGLGAVPIKKHGDVDLSAGDIEAGQVVKVVYDGTNFQMVSTPNTVNNADTVDGFEARMLLPIRGSVNGNMYVRRLSDSIAQVYFDSVDGGYQYVVLTDGQDLNSNAVRVPASTGQNANITLSGAGGLDTGTELSSRYYYVYLIYNPGTQALAALLSTNGSNNPAMPSGYTHRALAGYVYNDAYSNFEEVNTYRPGFGYFDVQSNKDVASVNAASELSFLFDFSSTPGSLSARSVLITVRGSLHNAIAWNAWERTTYYHGYHSGGQGTPPSAPSDPGANRVRVKVRNNGATQLVYVKVTIVGVE